MSKMITGVQKLTIGCLGYERIWWSLAGAFLFPPILFPLFHPTLLWKMERAGPQLPPCLVSLAWGSSWDGCSTPSQARTGKAEDSLACCLWVPEWADVTFKVSNNSKWRQRVLQDEQGRTEEKFFPYKRSVGEVGLLERDAEVTRITVEPELVGCSQWKPHCSKEYLCERAVRWVGG